MITTQEEFERTREYVNRLQTTLLDLRRTHSSSQYASMSKGFLKELAKAQREMTIYLATPVTTQLDAQ
jgi:hypothetical protein